MQQTTYVSLLALAAASFLLQVAWLFYLAVALFLVLLVSQAMQSPSGEPAEEEAHAAPAEPPASAQPQTIVITQGSNDFAGVTLIVTAHGRDEDFLFCPDAEESANARVLGTFR